MPFPTLVLLLEDPSLHVCSAKMPGRAYPHLSTYNLGTTPSLARVNTTRGGPWKVSRGTTIWISPPSTIFRYFPLRREACLDDDSRGGESRALNPENAAAGKSRRKAQQSTFNLSLGAYASKTGNIISSMGFLDFSALRRYLSVMYILSTANKRFFLFRIFRHRYPSQKTETPATNGGIPFSPSRVYPHNKLWDEL